MADAADYAQEIRDYLLGRLGRQPQTGPIPTREVYALPPPARRWWLFEGKRYPGLDAPLAASWAHIARMVRRLLLSFSPRRRILEVPEGRVDWAQTIQLNGGPPSKEYVCEASTAGLGEGERSVLMRWLSWVVGEWHVYLSDVGEPIGATPIAPILALHTSESAGSEAQMPELRRIAHVGRRSRWPLLRNVVAETLRCYLEPQDLDHLPLPSAPDKVFELLCLVRVLRHFDPYPSSIRWLIREEDNQVAVPGLIAHYQHTITRPTMLASSEFAGPLATAMELFSVRVPRSIDILVDLPDRPAGFDAVLIEVKSGGQSYDATLLQLKAYAAGIRSRSYQRVLIWGIVEHPPARIEEPSLQHLRASRLNQDDLWVFSGADDIPQVLQAVGLTPLSAPRCVARTTETRFLTPVGG